MLVHNRLNIRSITLRIIGAPIKPNHVKLAITGTDFFNHLFAITFVPNLTVACELALSFCLEVMNT